MMVNHMQWTNISNDEDGPQSVDSTDCGLR